MLTAVQCTETLVHFGHNCRNLFQVNKTVLVMLFQHLSSHAFSSFEISTCNIVFYIVSLPVANKDVHKNLWLIYQYKFSRNYFLLSTDPLFHLLSLNYAIMTKIICLFLNDFMCRGCCICSCNELNKSFPKSFRKSCVATAYGREWTRPLRMLAVQCPLYTSPITQPPVHATFTPHRRTHDDGIPR